MPLMKTSMLEFDRRQVLLGGMAALGALGNTSGTAAALAAATSSQKPAPATKLRVQGSAPELAPLAKAMPADSALMDALATEFSPLAARLSTQQTYWLAINGWITDRLSGPIMEGKVNLQDLGKQAWAIYASSYWGGIELRQNWGMPPAMEKLGIKISPPFTEVQQRVVDGYDKRMAALSAGGEACLQLLPTLMREDSTSGVIQPIAYNAGVQVVMTEDPPLGQRHSNRRPRPSAVRINGRDFMRVDYDLPTPEYLKVWRSAFERAVAANPAAYEQAIVGETGQKDLRDIWKRAVAFGNTTWGADASVKWTNEYFDDSLQWSSVLNFGLEAIGLAAFVAIVNHDAEAAKRAVMGNALYAGASSGWLIGFLDTSGKLPAVVPA
jgi:hypothetical protein